PVGHFRPSADRSRRAVGGWCVVEWRSGAPRVDCVGESRNLRFRPPDKSGMKRATEEPAGVFCGSLRGEARMERRRESGFVGVAVVLAVLAGTTVAAAQGAATSGATGATSAARRELLDEAERLYTAQQWRESLAVTLRAGQIEMTPSVAGRI